MTKTQEIFSYLIIIGSVQGLFLSLIFLFKKRGNFMGNRIFSSILISISISILTSLFYINGIYISYPILVKIYEPFKFAIGPLLYLYILINVNNKRKLSHKKTIHFIPMLTLLLYILVFSSLDRRVQLTLINNYYEIIFQIVSTLHTWIYIIHTNKIIKKSNNSNKPFIWLKVFIKGMFVIYTLFLIPLTLMVIGFNTQMIYNSLSILASISVFVISYYLILNPETSNPQQVKSLQKYKSSPLSNGEINRNWKRIKDLIEKERLYLNQDCSITDFSTRLNIPRQYISQIINQAAGKTFYELINSYRVEEVKRILSSDKSREQNILNIAFDSGFNSKTAFNTAFKKNTNTTPSLYKKKVLIDQKERQDL